MSEGEKKEELSIDDLASIYETRMLEIANNANDIIKRRLSGYIVDKSETENQELLMKDLLRMEKAIKHIKRIRGIEDDPEEVIPGSDERVLAKVKKMESSVPLITQKIN